MQVITTHVNADFDCLAAMVAAGRLYPGAHMVFSGSAERAVNDYLKETALPFKLSRVRDIDLGQVSRLILVDTQDTSRIGPFGPLAESPGVEVHVYDHHPEGPDGVSAALSVIRKRGAATTLLVELLLEKGIALSPEESTLMALGIFQDTASLLSPSTTAEDFSALARLVGTGADLNRVARYLNRELNPEQLDVLNELIGGLETHNINGVDIALATASAEHFIEDLAQVVHSVMDLENLDVLVALIRLDRRVYLIGRSRREGVDVAQLAGEFGGGGHPQAASAAIRDLTLPQAREKVLALLREKARPLYLVRDIMHRPVVSIPSDKNLGEAEKLLTRFNLNTLPVVVDGKPVGLITRQTVEKALHHKMARLSIGDFMAQEFAVTTPDVYFKTLVPIIIEEKQKLVPVVEPDSGALIGVVSRGDLLRVLYADMAGSRGPQPFAGAKGAPKNLRSLLKERLDKNIMHLLETVSQVAHREKFSVHVVGGFVRDLLLGIENHDVDLVVEGDGIAFARALGRELSAKVKSHAKFGTSVLILPDRSRVDVATSRMEYYKHPAALPTVEKGSVKADLFRRDFTVNSMAIKLNGENPFVLIDPFQGERDIRDRMIRVLHNLSFIEDPCRMFRAVRFEQRFGFRLGKQTEAFLKYAVEKRWVDRLSGSRLMNELVLLLKEASPVACIHRLHELGLLRCISPGLEPSTPGPLERIEGVLAWSKMVPMEEPAEVWYVYLLGLLHPLDEEAFDVALLRLDSPVRLAKRLTADREALQAARTLVEGKQEPGTLEIHRYFSALSPEAAVFLLAWANSERANRCATLYFTQYQALGRTALTGDDLIRMGVAPGPVFQKIFQALKDARLSGQIKNREDEMDLVKKQFLG